MKNKVFSLLIFSLITVFFTSCSDNVVVNFTFAPTMPKTGQKVTFTNTSIGDEDWTSEYLNWNFGDGSKSTGKNPYHIYSEAGIYTVTLMVDSNKKYTKSLDITVYDSIPTIYVNNDSVKYYNSAVFSVLAYNPKSLNITYKWSFSSNAKGSLVNGKSNSAKVEVYFDKRNVEETVTLHLKIGTEFDSIITKKVYIHDITSKSLVIAQKDGNLMRKRIFEKGLEDPTTFSISAGKHPFNIQSNANLLYIFDAGSHVSYQTNWLTNTAGDGSIKVVNMATNTATEIINNNGKSSHFGFYNGFVDNQYIYWTDYSEFIYRTAKTSTLGNFNWNGSEDAQTTIPYYLAKSNRLGYFGNGMAANQFSGGICYYDQAYFWAKGGSGRGIYRFSPTDILTANASSLSPIPTLGVILSNYAIRAFKIDAINQKIYFSVTAPADKIGLWVANMNGSNPKIIDDAPMDDASMYITGIVVDNESNKLYWAYRSPETIGAASPSESWTNYYTQNPTHRTGIKQAQLATQFKNTGEIQYFALDVSAYGIALDEIKK